MRGELVLSDNEENCCFTQQFDYSGRLTLIESQLEGAFLFLVMLVMAFLYWYLGIKRTASQTLSRARYSWLYG